MRNKYIYLTILIITINYFEEIAGAGNFYEKAGTLSGIVTDSETGEKLPGVNLLIKNTQMGTTTDLNGKFEMRGIPWNEFEMIVSYVGYKSETIKIKGSGRVFDHLEIGLKSGLIELGAVVVTGTNSAHLYENVPVKTEVVSKKLIDQTGSCNLAQALRLQTGVQVENDCNNCNFTQVRMLGFDGKYSQILIDGDPVVSALGGVYGLEHYPSEMIEQIEIVKGGGSSLYGGGAVAGTINLMTKRPAFNNSRIYFIGNSYGTSFDRQIGAVAELVSENNLAGLYIYGSTRSRNPYDRNYDGYSEIGQLNNNTIGFNGFLRIEGSAEIQLGIHRIYEERRGGSEFDKPVHEARIAEMTKHFKWGGKIKLAQTLSKSVDYKISYAFSMLNRDSYYGGLSGDSPEARLEALNFYGFSENPLHTVQSQLNYHEGSHNLSIGFQYDADKLIDKSTSAELYYLDEHFETAGLFLQDEISMFEDDLVAVAGVRFDKHSSLSDIIISPRINLRYMASANLSLRLGFTTGFKAPQIFDEDLHICGLEGTQRIIRNSTGLIEEKSLSFSGGFELQEYITDMPVLAGLTAFFTRLNGAYTDRFILSTGKVEYWERINSGGATVYGFEFDFGIKPLKSFEIRSGLTLKRNYYDENHPDFSTSEFLRTPDYFGFVRFSYDFNENINIFSAIKYTGSMYLPHEVKKEYGSDPVLLLKSSVKFVETDITVSWKVKVTSNVTSKLTFGIKNLADEFQPDLDFGYSRDPGYVYGPMQPRTFSFSIDLML